MKPEKIHLIHDLLDDQEWKTQREATLVAGGRLLRRRRWKRLVTRMVIVAGIGIIAAIAIRTMTVPQPPTVVAKSEPTPKMHYLTDDELLALFPNTPVGLATVGGKKVLIFPRPGDEERFVGHF
jgi:hypothetical protein